MSPSEQPPRPPQEEIEPKDRVAHPFRTLRELVDYVYGKTLPTAGAEEGGWLEALPFPFLAIVGQQEMKPPLLLENPADKARMEAAKERQARRLTNQVK